MTRKGDRFSDTAPDGRRYAWFLKELPDKPFVMRDINAPTLVVLPGLAAMRKLWDEMDDEDKADVADEIIRLLFGQNEEIP